jgi:hypothetical protein
MRSIDTEILIAAPAARIWSELVDFAAHPSWDPLFASLAGELEVGARLEVRFRQGMTMRPRVTELEPGRVLEWHGKLAFGGLFDGRHRFELVPVEGGTLLRHTEKFTGILVPLVGKVLRDTAAAFDAFNRAIAQRSENAGAEAWDARPA